MAGKPLAMLHPKNDGIKIDAPAGTELSVFFDTNIPEDEIWMADASGTRVKVINLRGQDGTGERQQRGKHAHGPGPK